MRSFGVLILIGILILAGVAAYLLWGTRAGSLALFVGQANKEKQVLLGKAQQALEPAPKKDDTKASKQRVRHMSKADKELSGKNGPRPEENRTLEAQVIPPSALKPVPAMPFPTAADIPVGMERNRLVGAFGKPSMRMTTVERDRLMETFVYLQNEPSTATFVLLQNAKVVSVTTATY